MTSPKFPDKLATGLAQTVLFYGTSLTEGGTWNRHLVSFLEARFPGQVTSINTAVEGQTSVWGWSNFQERVLAHRPDVLFMEFTVNDAVTRFEIPLSESRQNLISMLDLLQTELPECEVILQIMNPVIDRPEGHTGHRGNLETYCDQWRKLAAARGLLLIDHWPQWEALLQKDEATFRRYVPDGLHPNDEGYQAIVVPHLLRSLNLN